MCNSCSLIFSGFSLGPSGIPYLILENLTFIFVLCYTVVFLLLFSLPCGCKHLCWGYTHLQTQTTHTRVCMPTYTCVPSVYMYVFGDFLGWEDILVYSLLGSCWLFDVSHFQWKHYWVSFQTLFCILCMGKWLRQLT